MSKRTIYFPSLFCASHYKVLLLKKTHRSVNSSLLLKDCDGRPHLCSDKFVWFLLIDLNCIFKMHSLAFDPALIKVELCQIKVKIQKVCITLNQNSLQLILEMNIKEENNFGNDCIFMNDLPWEQESNKEEKPFDKKEIMWSSWFFFLTLITFGYQIFHYTYLVALNNKQKKIWDFCHIFR